MKCKLLIIRHGETDWNLERRIQGSSDRPLSAVGIEQANKSAEKFAAHSFSAIYSSPLIRARDTAQIIAKNHSCDLTFHADLQEGFCGEMEGLTKEEFQKKYQSKLDELRKLPFEARFRFKIDQKAESAAEIALRAIACLKTIAKSHVGEYVLVVSHGWVMRAILLSLENTFDDQKLFIENMAHISLDYYQDVLSLTGHEGIHQKSSWLVDYAVSRKESEKN